VAQAPRPSRRRRGTAALAVLLIALLPYAAAAQDQGPEQAVLDLTINTVAHGQIHVLIDGETIWADLEALVASGLVHAAGDVRLRAGRQFLRLDSIEPRPVVALDTTALTLTITAAPALFERSVVRFDTGRPADVVFSRATSAFVNYGATWSTSGARALNLETGASLGRAFATASFYMPSGGRASRGMTAVIVDDRDRLRRYQAGDAIAATGPLGGAIQLAGISVSRDFSLDPYFIRYPTTGLSGVVTTPSRVDVYVNNQLVRTLQVQPGAYELANLALPTGASDTRVVVRDAFGGQQEFGGSYYVTTSVLAPGVHQYQYAFGVERLHPFDSMWAYGEPVFTAVHRLGVNEHLTLGGRAEFEPGLASGGVTATARAGRFGAIELSGAVSHTGRTGLAAGLAYEYVGRRGGVSVGVRRAADDYHTLSTRRAVTASVNELVGSVTARLTRRLTGGLSWQAQDAIAPGGFRRAAATATMSLAPRVSLFLSATRSRVEDRWSTGAFATVSLSLSPRATASMSAERTDARTLAGFDVQQSAPVGPGFGFRGQVSGLGGAATMIDGELRAQSQWAQADIRQTTVEGRRETWAQVNGALVGIGGRVHASRPVQGGYALVRVPEVAGVRTYVSHQPMGRTDARGDLLVPNLLPYYGNRISIADSDVPIDRMVSRRELTLAPPYRGGAIAEFPAPREQRLSGRLVAGEGLPAIRGAVALSATVTLTGASTVETWLGSDGEFYVEGLEPGRYAIALAAPLLRCDASIDVPVSDAAVIRLGDVRCEATR
jgi:outer membrane usher protein